MSYESDQGAVWVLFDTQQKFQPVCMFDGFAGYSCDTNTPKYYIHWISIFDDTGGVYKVDVFYPKKKRSKCYLDVCIRINAGRSIKVKWRHNDYGFCWLIIGSLLLWLDEQPDLYSSHNIIELHLNEIANEHRREPQTF